MVFVKVAKLAALRLLGILPKTIRVTLREIQFAGVALRFLAGRSIRVSISDRMRLLFAFHRVSCACPE